MRRVLLILLVVFMCLPVLGCHRTLFPRDKAITQFDAYNERRYGPIITERRDPFGVPEPALEERLLIRDN